jgi:hypothetical protein
MWVFNAHMAAEHAKFKQNGKSKRGPSVNDLLQFASRLSFSVPILPGDASLAEDFVTDLKIQICKTNNNVDDYTILGVGYILFQLVILRTYLGRPPENDLDVFDLVHKKQVVRVWTSHEQALAACFGEDASADAVFPSAPNPSVWAVKTVNDPGLAISDADALVAIKARQPFEWQNRPGLTGGPHTPRRYKPPQLRCVKTGPRPKPRPAYRKVTLYGSDEGATSSARVQKRGQEEVQNVDMPARKRRSATNMGDHLNPPAMLSAPNNESHEGLSMRRRTRAMTKNIPV